MPQLSRLERLRKDWVPEWGHFVPRWTVEALREDYMPEMPPLEQGGYLVAYLLEIGPVVSGGMGPAPLEFFHIDAWCNRVGIDLQPQESRMIRRLSREYVSESQKAEKPDRLPPWRPDEVAPVVTDTQAALRALASL